MLLDTNLYMDIGIGNISNFLELKDLIKLSMIETAGIELPIFDLSFKTRNTSVKDRIIENNPIVVKLGINKSDFDSFKISVLTKKVEVNTDGYYTCTILGYLSNKRFLLDKVIRAINGTSVEGITQIGSEFFKSTDTDIDKVNETPQNWIVTNNSNQKLMTDMWLHMNIAPSFPLIGISRYGKVLLKDFDKLKKSTPKFTFVQKEITSKPDEIKYLNTFNVTNYTHLYNLYAGYGKVVNMFDQIKGTYSVFVNESAPNLASSKEVEVSKSGNRVFDGYSTSDNIHANYHKSYFYNTAKLMQLSNICGYVEFMGNYRRELNLLDLVSIKPIDSEENNTLSGRYVVNTIAYELTAQTPFSTKVYVCRDTLNNLENNIIPESEDPTVTQNSSTQIPASTQESLLENNKLIRRSSVALLIFLGTTLYNLILEVLANLKCNLANSFEQVGNPMFYDTGIVPLSSTDILGETIISSEELFTQILRKTIPEDYILLVEDLFYSGQYNKNTELTDMVDQWIEESLPSTLAPVYTNLLISLSGTVNTLVSESNRVLTNKKKLGSFSMLESTDSTTADRINKIISELLENVKGVDIPTPIIEIEDVQTYYDDVKLRNWVVDQIMDNLNYLGYLVGIDQDYFKSILDRYPSEDGPLLDYNTIQTINYNTGNVMYIRHWGSFINFEELTDYFVKDSFKDKFKTANCFKTIDARGGKRVFIALPSFINNSNTLFYINGIQKELSNTPISLHYFDSYNSEIPYSIYYSEEIFNSNSVQLEVRKK